MTKKKKKAGKLIVQTKHEASLGRNVTYQRELVLCGKADCNKRHGPYWYAYWRARQKELFGAAPLRKMYIGKTYRRLGSADFARIEKPPLGNKRRRALHKGAA